MNLTTTRVLHVPLVLSLAACAQFTTSDTERAGLQTAADSAAAAYVACLDREAGPYLGTTTDSQGIGAIARKNCVEARAAAARAQASLQSTSYILSEREVEAAMQALDDKGQVAITEQVLSRQAAVPAVAAVSAPAASAGGNAYLRCMQAQGERWASVKEPAETIAQAAHARCADAFSSSGGTQELERQGRDLVMGLVLDWKARR